MFFFFYLIFDLCFLTPAIIAHICNLIVELVIPIEKTTKEAKVEMKTHQ